MGEGARCRRLRASLGPHDKFVIRGYAPLLLEVVRQMKKAIRLACMAAALFTVGAMPAHADVLPPGPEGPNFWLVALALAVLVVLLLVRRLVQKKFRQRTAQRQQQDGPPPSQSDPPR
jgi:hypothetical protein